MAVDALATLKMILREDDIPFFTDDQLNFYLGENSGEVRGAAYQCLLIKAEDTTLSIGGLNTSDTSKYFRRLASQYRPFHSGVLGGGG